MEEEITLPEWDLISQSLRLYIYTKMDEYYWRRVELGEGRIAFRDHIKEAEAMLTRIETLLSENQYY